MEKRVFVTGVGIVSAIGNDLEENKAALLNKKCGISALELLDTVHKDELPCGEIKATNKELFDHLGIRAETNYPRTTLLAIHAAREAFNDAGLSADDPFKTGVILGTTIGGMDMTEKFYRRFDENTDFIKSHNCGYTTERVADYLNIGHFVTTLSTACSSGANAIMVGARLIKHGLLDRAVVGGADSLSKFTLNGFRTLYLLDSNRCAPFDKDRAGLNLGEGAAVIVLEGEESSRNKKRYCEVSGYANSNDAFHQTATSDDGRGPFLSMKNALLASDLKPEDIGYINVHGTGTDNNDLTEGIAMKRLFGDMLPPFSSTKSYTGHALGAAGAIEAVFSILAIKNNVIFPNLNFRSPIPEIAISPVADVVYNAGINHVMSNSFGFGGNETTLVFSK